MSPYHKATTDTGLRLLAKASFPEFRLWFVLYCHSREMREQKPVRISLCGLSRYSASINGPSEKKRVKAALQGLERLGVVSCKWRRGALQHIILHYDPRNKNCGKIYTGGHIAPGAISPPVSQDTQGAISPPAPYKTEISEKLNENKAVASNSIGMGQGAILPPQTEKYLTENLKSKNSAVAGEKEQTGDLSAGSSFFEAQEREASEEQETQKHSPTTNDSSVKAEQGPASQNRETTTNFRSLPQTERLKNIPGARARFIELCAEFAIADYEVNNDIYCQTGRGTWELTIAEAMAYLRTKRETKRLELQRKYRKLVGMGVKESILEGMRREYDWVQFEA